MSDSFFDQYTLWAFLLGGMSTVSLLLGCILGVTWKPRVGLAAAMTAFGAGALLAALSIELVAPTVLALVGEGHAGAAAAPTSHHEVQALFALLIGSLVGGLLFVLLDNLLNSGGGFLRKAATTITYFRKRRREYLGEMLSRLGQIECIRSIPPEKIQMLVDHVRPVSFEEGEQLFDEGTDGDRMFFIESGVVSLFRGGEPLATLRQGDVLGEIAVLSRAPRTAGAVATTPVVAIQLLTEDFERLRKQCPELEVAATRIAAERIDELQKRHDAGSSLAIAEEWAQAATGSVQSLPLPTVEEVQETAQEHDGAALSIWLGILLDGIPESFVIGAGFLAILTTKLASGSPGFFEVIPYTLIAGLFLSNFPEAMSSSIGMKAQGWKTFRIILMWSSLVLMTALGAVVGYSVGAEVSHLTVVAIEGLAAGAMLTMIAQTMIPEAVHLGGPNVVGLSTLSGFIAALAFKLLES